ncbi:MAG TPA: SOS response-associated peptidase [Pyrinomonadaceae bacterium]|nr:SOS response-associated peptidase [Chloracidobacterium sp.]MBP9107936.1 SOS response-associated peptidase [Pyrinomonadaceae bacterium]HQY67923.1 SOS response-associated peptidase [Pyrinomonadaceae bacterium]HRA39263.1 SOS response-associated peptidase [Pyrinomonadaceae bacterium]
MCGRASQRGKREDFKNYIYEFEPQGDLFRGNIKPTQKVSIVINDRNTVKTVEARWWCQLEGAKEWSTKYATFNANIERLESSPMWRNLLKSKRCIMPVTSFYEWPEKGKPPLEIFANGGHPFALAGLWSTWFDGGVRRESFAVITTAANDFMSAYHRAMPVILESKDIQKLWLLEGGMDILRGFECHLTGKPLTDKIENVYPDRSDGLA